MRLGWTNWTTLRLLPVTLALVFSMGTVWGADYFPDDYGDASREATFINPNGMTNYGVIGMDVDEDWFRFVALPGIAYKLEATTSTIWDVTLELRGLDGVQSLAKTNSSSVSSPVKASIIWTNQGAVGSYYVGVSAYLHFTTGTYLFAATPLNWTDTDQDGLPDDWENSNFAGLAYGANDDYDGDGFSNQKEYYAATNPTNRESNLIITDFSNIDDIVSFKWPSVSGAVYGVKSTTNMLSGSWRYVETNYCFSPTPSTQQWSEITIESNLFYRIELMTNQ